ncbi:MAG: monofunctional biosynthetic peptidoglycan transglycosylase [Methylobacteriaceae bacterium]|nr:monofunctional biosynthetic peptidoglycan transglycosylase [Methylobacteriaceae bacterium]
MAQAPGQGAGMIGCALRLALRAAVVALLALAGLMILWRFAPPVSTLMLARYVTGRPVVRDYASLDRISPALVASVVMSEDAKFCRHHGVDWDALGEVLDDEDGPSRGASTITMQVVKNLFLWPARSAIRKAVEIPLALVLDLVWPKRRIMEVYLNIAEWGPDGVFGAEAAARADFRRTAATLTHHQAALMAAALPNPILRRPQRPTRAQARHARRVMGRLADAGPWLDCLK